MTMIKGLHHNAYRCRDTEETRQFYEDFLGLPLIEAAADRRNQDRAHRQCIAYVLPNGNDGSCLAFFDAPEEPFEFKEQQDYDLHIALTVPEDELQPMLDRGRALGIESRGISEHGFVRSIYFRDPNGYVIELCAPPESPSDEFFDPVDAHDKVVSWQSAKST